MTEPIAEKITTLATPLAAALGLSLWGVEVAFGGQSVVRIFAEGENGVTIDQCAELSRLLGLTLEVEDILPGAYVLEVSSPGLERTFFTEEQLARAVGRQVEITLYLPLDVVAGRRKFRGELLAAPRAFVPAAEAAAAARAASATPDVEPEEFIATASSYPEGDLFVLRAEEVARPGEDDPIITFAFAAVRKAKQIHFAPEKPLPGKAQKASGKKAGPESGGTANALPGKKTGKSATHKATEKSKGAPGKAPAADKAGKSAASTEE